MKRQIHHQVILLVAIVVFSLISFGCERQGRAYGGGEDRPLGAPAYSAVAGNVSVLPGTSHIAEVAPRVAGALDGKQLYTQTCMACHQPTGAGVPGAFPPLDGAKYVTTDKVDSLAAIMIYGLSGPITVNGVEYDSVMAPLGAQRSDEEFAAIATYIRKAWSNKASAVKPEVFAEVRKKYGQRGLFTVSELDW